MPRSLGFASVKKNNQNVFLIEGAKGTLADDGTVTIVPVEGGHPWTLDALQPGTPYDLSALIDGTIEKLKGTYACTVAPTPANGMTASFSPHP